MAIIDGRFQPLIVLAGVAAVLAVATVIGRLAALRYSRGDANATITNLNDRIDAWWLMLALAAIAFAFGKAGIVVLFALLSFAALREFMTLTRLRPADHWTLLVAFFVAVPAQYYLIGIEWYGLYSILIPVYVFVLLPVISAIRGGPNAFLERVAEAQWGLMTCVYCLSHVPALATLSLPGFEPPLLVLYFLLVVQMSDVFQYLWGKWLGKTPVAPALSPAKTVEGAVLGILSASALGAGLWWMTPFAAWQAALLALVVSTMGFLGGLVMSAIKRDRGVKDWGWIVHGHGGVLDRLDSVVFSAPIFFHVTRYWWAAY